jgi:hypothetical protein
MEIDLGRRELRSRGIPVPLGGRAFEIVTKRPVTHDLMSSA